MKEPKKDWKIVVIETIGYVFIVIILLAGFLSGVFAAEGFLGDPNQWTWVDSHMMMQLALGIGGGILYLIYELKRWIKKRK